MQATFLEDRLGVEVELDIPDGWHATGRLVPQLGYPAELTGIANQELGPTGPGAMHDAMPDIAKLGPASALVWVTVGDYAFDREGAELTGPKRSVPADELRRRRPLEVAHVPPMTAGDLPSSSSQWPGYHQWARIIPVSASHYVTVYAWAPESEEVRRTEQPPGEIPAIVGSMKVRDYS